MHAVKVYHFLSPLRKPESYKLTTNDKQKTNSGNCQKKLSMELRKIMAHVYDISEVR